MTGLELKSQRVALGLSQREAANLIGCSYPHLSNLENGHRPIFPEMEKRIQRALFKEKAPLWFEPEGEDFGVLFVWQLEKEAV